MLWSVARTTVFSILILGAGLSLSGCAQVRLSKDFGAALKQDVAAQIADPDARYAGAPAPGSDGARVASAQERYQKGRVIPPAATSASTVGASSAAAPTLPQ